MPQCSCSAALVGGNSDVTLPGPPDAATHIHTWRLCTHFCANSSRRLETQLTHTCSRRHTAHIDWRRSSRTHILTHTHCLHTLENKLTHAQMHSLMHAHSSERKEKKNYVGSETLPTSIKERGPHWCTDRMTHPPRSSD